jgi:quercetin dioxygenase-like cupin family protein
MTTETTAKPYHLAAGDGEPMAWFTAQFQLKASHPELGVCELNVTPGVEPPLHVHAREDEWYYLLDGEVTFHVGGEDHRGQPGSFVFFPRGVPHTFTVEGESARMLLLNAPGGFERMFELAPTTPDEAVAALAKFDVQVVGPHPREVQR